MDSKSKVKGIIVSELNDVIKKYGRPRKNMLVYPGEIQEYEPEDDIRIIL